MKSDAIFTRLLAFAAAVLITVQFALMLYYPIKPFYHEILSVSKEFSLDPSLVRAVVFCESGFDPLAVSRAGAVGLMQLMPDTARFCIDEFDIQTQELSAALKNAPPETVLKDPEINLYIGAFYLSYLLNKFESEKDAVAAYNAGEGNVRNWKKQGLQQIPFPETREYVKRIQRAKRYYNRSMRNLI